MGPFAPARYVPGVVHSSCTTRLARNATAGPSRLPSRSLSSPSRFSRKLRLTFAPATRELHTTPRADAEGPLKVAIIGSGPSGFYTASRILSSRPLNSPDSGDVEVHMYERLPTPYGLVRYGVAPDHPDVKNCQHKFDELASDPRFKWFGNVNVGSPPSSTPTSSNPPTTLSSYTYPHALHLPLSSLLPYYNSLILTYGASLSNPLSSVPGSSSSPSPLRNVIPALAFVSWYNAHPAFADLPVDLRGVRNVTVVGQGNVALDVARFLLRRPADLQGYDVPEAVLQKLEESSVESVTLVGRRGAGQVAFTTKELREMVNFPNVEWGGLPRDGPSAAAELQVARETVQGDRARTRMLGIMEKPNPATAVSRGGPKKFNLDFVRSPKAFLGSPGGKVEGVEWEINELLLPPSTPTPNPPSPAAGPTISQAPTVTARPTGQRITTETDMVIESVGYRSEPLLGPGWELPFDLGRGRVYNVDGRVVDAAGIAIPNVYAGGWVARGPVGVIASTMHDAYSLASCVLSDHFESGTPASAAGPMAPTPPPGVPPQEIVNGLRDGVVVDLKRWERIDRAEIERGKGKGKSREKFRTVEEMLAI